MLIRNQYTISTEPFVVGTPPKPRSTQNIEEDEIALSSAQSEAERILTEARLQAESLLTSAQSEIESWWTEQRSNDASLKQGIIDQAKEEGYQEGLELGTRQALEEYRNALDQSQEILNSAYDEKVRILAESDPLILDLAVVIAEHILTEKVKVDPETVIPVITKALTQTTEKESITIGVCPEYFAFVSENRERLLRFIDSQAELRILPDYGVTDGGCVVRTSMGNVDARISTSLEEIKTTLRNSLRK